MHAASDKAVTQTNALPTKDADFTCLPPLICCLARASAVFLPRSTRRRIRLNRPRYRAPGALSFLDKGESPGNAITAQMILIRCPLPQVSELVESIIIVHDRKSACCWRREGHILLVDSGLS